MRPIDFELPDHAGGRFRLSDALRERTMVVVFYRGDWWPYCNGQLVSFAREHEEFTKRDADLVAVSVDTIVENAAMVAKLRLPFPLLSDPDAAAIAGWDVYDPVGGAHGPIARPAIFVVGRDLRVAFDYVGRDFADRPPNAAIYAALEEVRGAAPRALGHAVTGRGPRAADAGNQADKPMPFEDIAPYFRGAGFAAQALAGRVEDPALKAECERLRLIAGEFVKAAVQTRHLLRAAE